VCTRLPYYSVYTVSQKREATWCLIITLTNVDQFSKFFHQLICEKILYAHTHRLPSHLRYVDMKVENPEMLLILTASSTSNQLLTGHFEHLIWQLLDRLSKTADIKWLTNILKFVRWRLESTVERCSVECCCIVVIFFTIIIFSPSSFFLRYTSCIIHM